MTGNVMEKSWKSYAKMKRNIDFSNFVIYICCLTDFISFFISTVLTDACAHLLVLCQCFIVCEAVRLQCSHVENNPIRLWESVIRCNPSTAMKNRVRVPRQKHSSTDILFFIKEFMIILPQL